MRMKFASIAVLTVTALVFASMGLAHAQQSEVRASPNASVSQTIGTTKVTINYCRPAVKGRKIWGGLESYGKVWRAGANENTTIEFSKDVKINGKALPAGKYGFFILLEEDEWTLIFSKKNNAWGAMGYDAANDALRITVKPEDAPHQERLVYGFEELTDTSGVAYMHWEKKKAPFKIEVEN